jgi:hypothetical protein
MKKPTILLFPHSMAGAEAVIRRSCTVVEVEYLSEGIRMRVIADQKIIGKYKEFIQNDD